MKTITMLNEPEGSLAFSAGAIRDELDEWFCMNFEGAGELLLVRHAQPARGDDPNPLLTCLGLQQAERLADRLDSQWIEAIFTAPERSCQQTAAVLANRTNRPLHAIGLLADLEFHVAKAPHGITPREQVESFNRQLHWDSLAGFEGSKAFRRRVVQAIERILAISSARRVVVVTHSSVINTYISMLLSIPADQFFAPEHASVSSVRWHEDRYAVRSLNDVSHLVSLPLALSGQLAASQSLLTAPHSCRNQ